MTPWQKRCSPACADAGGGYRPGRARVHLVADPADVGAFGDAIVELLQEPPLAVQLGQAARERLAPCFSTAGTSCAR
jgi:glycosyltransferase involved in cell wall biosynthesis